MDVFLARQPIFDLNKKIYGYEILYRSGVTNSFDNNVGADEASSKVILDTLLNFGLEELTECKYAFINFSCNLIKEEMASLFPKEYLVIELLETIEPCPDIVEKCRALTEAGYTLALDDFIYSPIFEPLLDLVSIIKVDFVESSQQQIRELKTRLNNRQITLLAEKVETWEEFNFAKELGFELFQGYFFAKPEIMTTIGLTPSEMNCFQLITKINQEEFDFQELSEIISRDLSLTYNLLKLVNSAAFGHRQQITSIKHALVILGKLEIKKWVTLIALQEMSNADVTAPVNLSLFRGRFAELLAQITKWNGAQGDLFITGLFSLLDVLLQRPMQGILEEIQASPEIKEVLLYHTGPFQEICNAVFTYEKGDWNSIEHTARQLNLKPADVATAYLEALRWQPYN